jgi:hypothetical protein
MDSFDNLDYRGGSPAVRDIEFMPQDYMAHGAVQASDPSQMSTNAQMTTGTSAERRLRPCDGP